MTDVKDTSRDTSEVIAAAGATDLPALDGSVDALVANLRAAKEQLAALLRATDHTPSKAVDDAAESDRSAA
ncbi:MAG: hypothetical protein APF80_05300 [Alphaproteobacteria bacterium BRH_c36]|nr:MAG: hypothetical protein APF80_05300 [Alphaproteobacteria bacterium BRH_c36]